MKVIRNNEEVSVELEELTKGDTIICKDYEELVKIGRDLAYINKRYRQIKVMELTIE